ncbi:hypothetical protein RN001_015344 [Aquatica leii]|uniref:Tectonic-1-3 N-terminal domain-containing protein n=1 Tax=Aquatica leii TaxID=1421715 RepID=A0AAN7SNH4_9COLE|nr:hypothetical protein RN001_015344 [Aquatica leii]
MAEVHIIGEISNAKRFPKQSLFCKWSLQCGNNWNLISGKKEGQTHVVSSEFDEDCRWCFPIDVHLATKGVQGWPKIYIEVYHLDWWGRSHLFGYGYVIVPTTPGAHQLECYTWQRMLVLLVIALQWGFLYGETTTSVTETFCDLNDTACGVNESTTVSPPNATKPGAHLEVYQHDVDTCTCDLHRQFCDVNCCCDKDCGPDEKKVFSVCHLEPNVNRDTSFCSYVDQIYLNNTPYEWEVNQNGLFCIVKTNLPPKYTLQSYQTIPTFEASRGQKYDKYVWPETEMEQLIEQFANNSYIYGSDIWVLRNHTLVVFELSTSFITHICLKHERVKYLNNLESECSVAGTNPGNNAQLESATYYKNISFVRDPKLLNTSIENIWKCPQNACLSVTVKDCSDGNCTVLNGSKTVLCRINDTTNQQDCVNLVHKAHYVFYHNGSMGLTRVELLLTLKNFSFLHADYEFGQKFERQPRYITGKPVLLGNLDNGTVSRDPKLIYDNFLVFPVSRQGWCVLNNELHVVSEFRYNMVLKCRVFKEILKGNSSASGLCRQMQTAIFSFWPVLVNSSMEKVVGGFGNANESVEADWVKVLWSNSSDSLLNDTLGNFTDGNRTLICHNLITILKVDVFHAQIDLEKLLRQEKIVATAVEFGPGRVHVFRVDDQMYLDVMIEERVTYFDVTTERVEKYAQPPAFKINLPYDFFYPFVKVGNSAHAFCLCYLVKFLMYFNVVITAWTEL